MWLEQRYIESLQNQVRNFSKKSNTLYNFSCPICGDSAKDSSKARGYVYFKEGKFLYRCHNCGAGTFFTNFLRMHFPLLYKQYSMEKFRRKTVSISKPVQEQELAFEDKDIELKNLCIPLDMLSKDHKALRYIKGRCIPKSRYSDIYFINNLSQLKATFPNYDTDFKDGPRVIFPIRNRKRKLLGVAARATYDSSLRYINLKKETDEPLIFNLENINFGKTIYVTEGAIDSMFLPNCLAVSGADFEKLDSVVDKNKCILIFDNQPRNYQIVKRMEKIIDKGWRVVVWPEQANGKDINNMILNGMPLADIYRIINTHVYEGLTARIKLNKWKKVG